MDLTPEEREKIYLEEKARLEARQKLKAENRKTGFGTIAGGVALGVIVLLSLLSIIGSLMRETGSREGHFYSDTLSYLNTLSDEAMKLSMTMTRASGLDAVKGALLTARSVESAGYEKYFRSRTGVGVDESLRGLTNNTDEAHRLFQQAMDEFLMYWVDGGTAHIANGNASLQRSISEADTVARELNAQPNK